jgi:hypothetical protein
VRRTIIAVALLSAPAAWAQEATASVSVDVAQVVAYAVMFLALLYGAYVALGVFLLVRGGELATPWFVFTLAAISFAVGRALDLASLLEMATPGGIISYLPDVIGAVLLLLGFVLFQRSLR